MNARLIVVLIEATALTDQLSRAAALSKRALGQPVAVVSMTLYAHLNAVPEGLGTGDQIAAGDIIGNVGATGTATGPNLHYEVRVDGRTADPLRDDRLTEVVDDPAADSAALARLSGARALLAEQLTAGLADNINERLWTMKRPIAMIFTLPLRSNWAHQDRRSNAHDVSLIRGFRSADIVINYAGNRGMVHRTKPGCIPFRATFSAQTICGTIPVGAQSRNYPPNKSVGPSGKAGAINKAIVALAALFAVGACSAPVVQASDEPSGFIEELPEQLVALAAPYQNLQGVRLMPEDSCYWYSYTGPVETTMLPLRTVDGRSICVPRE